MTTITFKENINLKKYNFDKVEDFLKEIAYEESLEEKLQISKNSDKNDFINL